jgi:hypothetical protein
MCIEPRAQEFFEALEERNISLQKGTLRSSGAKRSLFYNLIYKHLAALRPEFDLVWNSKDPHK